MSDCILHQGRFNKDGYGIIGHNNVRAHRLAWAAKYGAIPKGMYVCHSCDVRACVNVEHLFLGSNQENIDDKVRKGRALKTLSADKCDLIKSLYETKNQYQIAEHLGITQGTVSRVLRGQRKYLMIGGY